MNFKNCLVAVILLSALPGLAWSHPGHGLDGLWIHDFLHAATAGLVIALVVMLSIRFIRRKRSRRS
ncbi:MAG: hypothetical protein WD071_13575 [Pseudohongiella sp.]|uniref:hypothetical protein n=1 Tax=Pseudohongiella sp. TaxID=1979412 RepID=UPI00349FF3D7